MNVWEKMEYDKEQARKAYQEKCDARSKIQMPKKKIRMYPPKYHTNQPAEMLRDLISYYPNFKLIGDDFDNREKFYDKYGEDEPDQKKDPMYYIYYDWFEAFHEDLADQLFNEDRDHEDLWKFITCLEEEEQFEVFKAFYESEYIEIPPEILERARAWKLIE